MASFFHHRPNVDLYLFIMTHYVDNENTKAPMVWISTIHRSFLVRRSIAAIQVRRSISIISIISINGTHWTEPHTFLTLNAFFLINCW